MTKFEKVKYYYEHSLWGITRVRNAVKMKWITTEEYSLITGEDYE